MLHVGATVNAANDRLIGGCGGLNWAIHSVAGPSLLAACSLLNGCETGEVKTTPGVNLPGRFIVHAVSPQRDQSGTRFSFYYLRALDVVVSKVLPSVALSCLSSDIFGFDKSAAAGIALGLLSIWFSHRGTKSPIERIVVAINQDDGAQLYVA
jgi:O-acetyl-ADP-ribose deacetylase (regulator of RNase III)